MSQCTSDAHGEDRSFFSKEYFTMPLQDLKREHRVQSSLDVFQSVFKFVPTGLLRFSKSGNFAKYESRLLDNPVGEETIHNIFMHALAPFIFKQFAFDDSTGNASNHLITEIISYIYSLQSDIIFKLEESTFEKDVKLFDFIETVWKTVLDMFVYFKYFNDSSNFIMKQRIDQTNEKLEKSKEVLEVIDAIKLLYEDINGSSNQIEVAICALVALLFNSKSLKYIGIEDSVVDDEITDFSLYEVYCQNKPYDYHMHSQFSKLFLENNMISHGKWAAYRAILINPFFIDSFAYFIEARSTDISSNETLCQACSCLDDELHIFKGYKYKDFSTVTKLVREKKKLKMNFDEVSLSCSNNAVSKSQVLNLIEKEPNIQKKKSENVAFKKAAKEGSEAYCNSSFSVAVEKYEIALKLVSTLDESVCKSPLDVIVLKYCYSMACIFKRTYEDITRGLQCLRSIIADYPLVSFPLAYYGQAKALMEQNRFHDALEPLLTLMDIFDKQIPLKIYFYPCCNKKIEESQHEQLKESVKILIETCRSPPPPVGVCFFKSVDYHFYREIYYSDPDFLGFTRMVCSERCHLYFHYHCWENFKKSNKLRHQKDWDDMKCITPDCNGCLSKIEIIRADGVIKEIHPNTKIKNNKMTKDKSRPEVKTKKEVTRESLKDLASSPRKARGRTSSEPTENCPKNENRSNTFTDYEVKPDLRIDGVQICKKKTLSTNLDLDKKMLKTPTKCIINTEFKLTDEERLNKLRQFKSQICEDSSSFRKSSQLSSSESELFNSQLTSKMESDDDSLKLQERALTYLENIVERLGNPIRIDNECLNECLAVIPEPAQAVIETSGGIEKFLQNSKKLFVLNGYICEQISGASKKADENDSLIDGNKRNCSQLFRSASCQWSEPYCNDYINNGDTSSMDTLLPSQQLHSDTDQLELQIEQYFNNRISIQKSKQDHNFYFFFKKILSLDEIAQLEIFNMIFEILKKFQPVGYDKTKNYLALEDIFKNFSSTYKIVTQAELNDINLVHNLKSDEQLLKQQLEYASQKISSLLKENEQLKTNLTTMLERISNFMDANESEKAATKERDLQLQNEIQSLNEENLKLKVVISDKNVQIMKLNEDISKDKGNEINRLKSEKKAIEEERNKLQLELQEYKRKWSWLDDINWSSPLPLLQQKPELVNSQNNKVRPEAESVLNDTCTSNVMEVHMPNKMFSPKKLVPTIPPGFSSPLHNNVVDYSNIVTNSKSDLNDGLFQSQIDASITRKYQFPTVGSKIESLSSVVFENSSFFTSEIAQNKKSLASENETGRNPPSACSSEALATAKSYSSALSVPGIRKSEFGKYWRIIQIMQPEYPKLKRVDFAGYLNAIRISNGRKLSGLTIRDIIERLKREIAQNSTNKGAIPKVHSNVKERLLRLGSFAATTNTWKKVPQAEFTVPPNFEYSTDICAICHEKMKRDVYMLKCGHKHHLKCLENWYQQQTTCPICREHCPLFDDYPPLK